MNIPALLNKQKMTIEKEFLQFINRSDVIGRKNWLKLLLCSDFAKHQLQKNTLLIQQQWQAGEYQRHLTEYDFAEKLSACIKEVNTELQLLKALRDFRQQQMLRIAYRDINDLAQLTEILYEQSVLADCIIRCALQWLEQVQQEEFGQPLDSQGLNMPLLVIAMGKLGAGELNFSSDVDLIFAFAEQGQTVNGSRCISNNEYFIKLGQRLINALHKNTVDGFVFRVDMRLRPFGQSGPLVMSFNALENYYTTHGREWERYALIKARLLNGTKTDEQAISAIIKPFVYRRYIDFGVFDVLREMKSLICSEVKQKNKEANIKLGAGGIREIEFMVQVLQLLKGGCDLKMQQRRVLKVLPYTASIGLLAKGVVTDLIASYHFLRCTEHRIQQINDQQCHDLPQNDYPRAQIAYGMGYADWDAFVLKILALRDNVHYHFEQLLQPQQCNADDTMEQFRTIWQGALDEQQAAVVLTQSGYHDGVLLLSLLKSFRQSRNFIKMSREGGTRLDHLMPLLLQAAALQQDSETTFKRLLLIIESICRRSVYMVLLIESAPALQLLATLCAASPWISRLLSRYPALFDELQNEQLLYVPLKKDQLLAELEIKLAVLDKDDLERRMEILHYFKQSHTLRVAAADIARRIPLMQVSDYLSWIAEAVLQCVLQTVWNDMLERYGLPEGLDSEPDCGSDYGFGIIAFGKLGGLELGYGSDLDLVFIYNNLSADSLKFYSRMSLRILHILQTRTHSGILYEADMRLRPDGQSGLICSSIEAFAKYEQEKAWLWEHQALIRARFICGDQQLNHDYRSIRREVLSRVRDTELIKKEVRQMREKMRHNLLKKKKAAFDIKQGSGGLVDIEFIVQFLVLSHAARHPHLLYWTDNIRILQSLAKTGALSESRAQILSEYYQLFRVRLHYLSLQEVSGLVPVNEFVQQRKMIQEIWLTIME